MMFAKQEFIQKVGRLEKLLEKDFGALAVAARKGGMHRNAEAFHRQKLMEQLQFHDIIRQKIQHVGEFADVLENEFTQYGVEEGVCILPGLLELSMALLQFARLEYDEVREEIQVQLIALSLSNCQIQDNYQQFQQEMQEMIKCLGKLYLQIESAEEEQDMEISADKLRKICQSFSMQTEREIFRSLFNQQVLPKDLHEQEDESSDAIELF